MADEPKIESEPPLSRRRPRNWRDPATVTGVIAGVTALVAAIAALRAPDPPEKKAEASYEVLSGEIRKLGENQQKLYANQRALEAWMRGFYKAQGIDIEPTVGAPPPQVVELEVQPPPKEATVVSMLTPPTSRKPAAPVGVKVLTPLPKPSPKPEPATLPSAEAL